MKKYDIYFGTAIRAILEAQPMFLEYYGKPINFEMKDDNSRVTRADKEIEEMIYSRISKAFPTHGFIGEEFGSKNEGAAFKWIIDPIDGTNNLIREIPICGTLLALMHNDKIVLGISNIPKLNELSYAIKGQGAFINGKQVHVSKKNDLKEAWITHGGMHHFAKYGRIDAMNNIFGKIERARGFGDLYGYTVVARGMFDALISRKAKVYDQAPGGILIEEAGGKVTDLNGNPITIHSTNVLATNGLLHNEILELLNS